MIAVFSITSIQKYPFSHCVYSSFCEIIIWLKSCTTASIKLIDCEKLHLQKNLCGIVSLAQNNMNIGFYIVSSNYSNCSIQNSSQIKSFVGYNSRSSRYTCPGVLTYGNKVCCSRSNGSFNHTAKRCSYLDVISSYPSVFFSLNFTFRLDIIKMYFQGPVLLPSTCHRNLKLMNA